MSVGDIAYIKVISVSGERAKVSLEEDSGAQGAIMAIDNATGDIKAMIGGRDYEESKFNRATQALRQTGSSFKPYVYTTAVEELGITPDDTILDAPISFPTSSGPYTPHNYDGKFEGVISLRRAIADSRNIPALKLADRVGIHKVIDMAHRFGVAEQIQPYLPMALGAAEVTLTEQVAAYATFPNDGVRVTPRYITKVTDYDGRVLEEDYPDVRDVIKSETARTMVDFMREPILHGTALCGERGVSRPCARRQDGDDERLHRRMVHRVLTLSDLRSMGWVRREEDVGSEGDGGEGSVANLDGLYEGGAERQGQRGVHRRACASGERSCA